MMIQISYQEMIKRDFSCHVRTNCKEEQILILSNNIRRTGGWGWLDGDTAANKSELMYV